ncbi:uncharacterized protein LOC135963676 [Calliphora vicina]|uniref:uncharacterized protein LOC135963676 n=1 Tax=Calliphora vicina TaxID=7373 RepID=UPI00325A84F6
MEEILSNKNILCDIFKFINLKDLLTAAKVCRVFRTVIIEFILKNTYTDVKAYKTEDCYYIVSNKVEEKFNPTPQRENRIVLNATDFWEFLNLNTNNIQILSLQTETSDKELMIEELNCEKFFYNFHNRILSNLKHLRKLTLISTNSFLLTKKFFITLTNCCSELQYLCLQYCNVKEFTPVFTLHELELRHCNGFTWNNFQTILSQMNLQTFTSYATRYTGKGEYFDIDPNLKHISLHYSIVNNIKTLFCRNQAKLKNLKSLDWSVDYSKQSWINSTNCPNLERLKSKPRNLLFDNLSGFMSLHSLILDVNNDLTDSDIVQIIKHPTLNSFTINTTNYNWLIDTYEYNSSYETEWANFTTNLLHINLSYHKTLSSLLHNWFNLLVKNSRLSLKLKFRNSIDIIPFEDIFCHPSFLRHLKSINICGYIIDCGEFGRNYSTLIDKAAIILEDIRLNENDRYIKE